MATSKSKAIDLATIIAALAENEALLNELFKNEKVKLIIKQILGELAEEQAAGKKPWYKKVLNAVTAVLPYLLSFFKRK